MTSFDYPALWSKAKVFVDRALMARDGSRQDEYHLWAALTLEILGKASLSAVHPTLVADPTHFPSMLAAVGRQQTPDLKSITARTLFDRLTHVVSGFDQRMQSLCNTMAERRNAELHSGQTPLVGLDDRAWVPPFWQIVNVMLSHQNRTLEDFVGREEAARIAEVLRNQSELTRQTVLARIARRASEIDDRYGPIGSSERTAADQRASARPLPTRFQGEADEFEDAECPACRMKGWLFGAVENEEITQYEETDPEWGPALREWVEITYSTERFVCSECGLILDGHEELAIAELPSDFLREEEHEPDYEPEYGNE